jgi:transposase InsO family protein
MIVALVGEATAHGARPEAACAQLGLSYRAVQRWRVAGGGEDRRYGPKTSPRNRLTEQERSTILTTVNSAAYRDLSPKQIVPRLADEGIYIASESTIYRLLRQEGQMAHRGRAKAPTQHTPEEYVATGPNQVWTWDITYLPTLVQGRFFFLYMFVDIYSRRIMGWAVHDQESMVLAAQLLRTTCTGLRLDPAGLVLHADNGGPMRGSTMLATLHHLGIVSSFSRPGRSDDNPFSESLFRTLKYRPSYPPEPFKTLAEARAWVTAFMTWYNHEHLHSALRFVTPDDRYHGRDKLILPGREHVYEQARQRHPERWSRGTRNWTPTGPVRLNPRENADIDTTPDKEGATVPTQP